MTNDTLFDLASLTKPIATATSIMILAQNGKISVDDKVSKHLPEFKGHNKENITIFQLLTHQGGLIPDNALSDYNHGPEEAINRIYALKEYAPPGSKFIYTDVGFIILAELVKKVSGQNIHTFSHENIFKPLGMTETGFLPSPALCKRAAVTEKRNGKWMQGEVHDPRAYRLGGIAGHAGLFSTASDLAIFAQMMLNRGQYKGVRILEEEWFDKMTRPYPVPDGQYRGLGWDIQSKYSSNRGKKLSPSAFGHGGFTGTSIWIDPDLDLFVIFLSNRVHPDGKGSVNQLAGQIADIAVDSLINPNETCTLTGIDILQQENFKTLNNCNIGLITNQTGVNRNGIPTSHLLHQAENVNLKVLFSPEHGPHGLLDVSKIEDSKDDNLSLPIYSLYGETKKPTPEMLRSIDTLVFDIQDIGARFYTYISTMGYAMEAASQHNLRFIVLDRPNPINGTKVEGPMLDSGSEHFAGYHNLPVRHGMTIGELALMFHAEKNLNLDLKIIKMKRWHRHSFHDATDLLWINPSPNMRNLTQALLYPGIGLLEFTNLSVGRGTDTPFEIIGAPWIHCRTLSRIFNTANLPGVTFTPITFIPKSSKFANKNCYGVRITITDRNALKPVNIGLEIAHVLRTIYPKAWDTTHFNRLLCNKKVCQAILIGDSPSSLTPQITNELEAFKKRRLKHLLYR